jgi:hypothetical protein
MEVEFRGQYSKALLFKAIALAYRPSRRGVVLRTAIVVILAGINLSTWVLTVKQLSVSPYHVLSQLALLAGLLLISFYLFRPYIAPYFLVSGLWKNPLVREPLAGRISSERISYLPSMARPDVLWDDFMRVWKTENLVVLLTADAVLLVFPRSFFKDEDDWRQFLQWVASKVVEAK